MIERQEIYCHNCQQYVQFNIDMELDGNHVLKCPVCGHEHCRVVKNGIITEDRWDSRNGLPVFQVTNVTNSQTSLFSSSSTNGYYTSTGGTFISNSWLNISTFVS